MLGNSNFLFSRHYNNYWKELVIKMNYVDQTFDMQSFETFMFEQNGMNLQIEETKKDHNSV